ncbi:MAG: hypothetical protein KJT03_03090 [Verrucomicrobiae bacterium]|nr:hypothetical protein [Verrucomicrobiae bacterium]
MKNLLVIQVLFLAFASVAFSEELRFGEKKRLDRVSLMKIIVDPASLVDEEVQVSGYVHNVESGMAFLFFNKEFMKLYDMGNAVRLKGDPFYEFLHKNAEKIIGSGSYHMIVQGVVRHDPTIKNRMARTWIDVSACAIYIDPKHKLDEEK